MSLGETTNTILLRVVNNGSVSDKPISSVSTVHLRQQSQSVPLSTFIQMSAEQKWIEVSIETTLGFRCLQ